MMNDEEIIRKQPLLTIAVPTYNGAKTIRDMMDIMLPQVTDEMEVLVSDNCSTDKTPEIIHEYQKKYGFIRYIRNEENLGADGNFLQCLQKASGDFVMLISDDDIIVEDALGKILSFLKNNPDISLAYLESVAFKDKYKGVSKCHGYKFLNPVEEDRWTYSKKEFLHYCQRLFGFTSSYVWSTSRLKEIDCPEQYFGTYFLQAYMNILCSNKETDKLGIIGGPCIAIGEYGVIGNYDMAEVEGIFYHKMVDFAVNNGYPKNEMEKFYLWKIIFLCRNNIIRERATGVKKTSLKNIFKATKKYPKAWVELYPFLLVPPFVCRIALKTVRRIQGRNFVSYVNRPTD